MAEYVLRNFRKNIKYVTLQEAVLGEHAVPNNVAEVYPKKLDSFIKESLSEQKKFPEGQDDRNLAKIQREWSILWDQSPGYGWGSTP